MSQTIPVNNKIIKWARETSGLSIAEVARKLKKTSNDIKNWEQGISTPTYYQLEKLAYKIYKRPIVTFFFPEIPKENTPRAEFRTLPEEIVDTMPPEIIKLYRRAKVYQLNLNELDNEKLPKETRILENFELSSISDQSKLAQAVRSFINTDIKTQISWKSLDEAVESWRSALTSCGIYIFKDAFRNDQYSGLSIYDENYPVILINNSMPQSRQIFSIFHELGHLLYKAGGVDIIVESFYNRLNDDYLSIEQRCNQFAGEFLLPSDIFEAYHSDYSEKNISEIANTYKVSREVVLRKYLNFNLITPEIYKSYTEKWLKEYIDLRKRKKEIKPGGDHYNNKKLYLGEYYTNLAFSHYYQGKYNIETLADYLGMKVGNVPTFEGYVVMR